MTRSLNYLKLEHKYLWLLFILLLALSSPTLARSTGKSSHVEYQFKRGDTLIHLANKYFRKRSDYRVVQRLNRIKNPYKIHVGKTLSIPFHILKYRQSEASLSAYRGDVSIADKGQILQPVKGLDITEGCQLTTAAGSFLTLQLEDGSRVSMPSNSKVRITRLRHILLTDSVDYELTVDRGRLRSKVTPFGKKPGSYKVRTPVSVSAVRGTDYRTRVDSEAGMAFSETVEGAVDIAAGAASVAVPEGTGASATPSGQLKKADLLSPPTLIDPEKVQSEELIRFNITPREAAASHRVSVSSDEAFVDIVAEQLVGGNEVSMSGIPNGNYFAKATSISKDGFEGMPSFYAFKRSMNTLSGNVEKNAAGSGNVEKNAAGYKFTWSGQGSGKRYYRFQLLRASKTGDSVVDETALTADSLTLSHLPDGDYYWRVGVTQFVGDGSGSSQRWTEFQKLMVES